MGCCYYISSEDMRTNYINFENSPYINAEIYIKEEDINQEIRIINSFENVKREKRWEDKENDYIYANEKEIERCTITINGKINVSSQFFRFKQEGKYQIKYSFQSELTNINYMFYGCNSLAIIDLSNFNTHNVTNMGYMFNGCISLKNINLSNVNTGNVTNLIYLFGG